MIAVSEISINLNKKGKEGEGNNTKFVPLRQDRRIVLVL